MNKIVCLSISLLIASCVRHSDAPVTEVDVLRNQKPTFQYAASGDTLYSIAFLENIDYQLLAKWNNLSEPYILTLGQRVELVEPQGFLGQAEYTNDSNINTSTPNFELVTINDDSSTEEAVNEVITEFNGQWKWPTSLDGNNYKLAKNNALDLFGSIGSPVNAAATGTVVYAGNALKGYGNLVIIKHNDEYLSAYAYNQKIIVKENDFVNQGQKIAELGSNDENISLLRFEIRKNGKSVNPLNYLE